MYTSWVMVGNYSMYVRCEIINSIKTCVWKLHRKRLQNFKRGRGFVRIPSTGGNDFYLTKLACITLLIDVILWAE